MGLAFPCCLAIVYDLIQSVANRDVFVTGNAGFGY